MKRLSKISTDYLVLVGNKVKELDKKDLNPFVRDKIISEIATLEAFYDGVESLMKDNFLQEVEYKAMNIFLKELILELRKKDENLFKEIVKNRL